MKAQTADDWSRVSIDGTLVVGTSADYPPFESYNSNFQIDGFDIALARELGDRLGVNVVVNDFDFSGLPDALQLGKVDAVIGAVSVTPDRQKVVDFTNLYYIDCRLPVEKALAAAAMSPSTSLAAVLDRANARTA